MLHPDNRNPDCGLWALASNYTIYDVHDGRWFTSLVLRFALPTRSCRMWPYHNDTLVGCIISHTMKLVICESCDNLTLADRISCQTCNTPMLGWTLEDFHMTMDNRTAMRPSFRQSFQSHLQEMRTELGLPIQPWFPHRWTITVSFWATIEKTTRRKLGKYFCADHKHFYTLILETLHVNPLCCYHADARIPK